MSSDTSLRETKTVSNASTLSSLKFWGSSQHVCASELEVGSESGISKDGEKSWKQKHFTGSRMGTLFTTVFATSIMLINLILFVWALEVHSIRDGLGAFYSGTCNNAKRKSTFLQIAFNIQCTALLGASNYCMQCLSAPTREDVNRAHAKKKALCIGAPSFTNLINIDRKRAIVWVLLGLSALPIHFLYNSVLLLTTQGNTYKVMAGPENFLEDDFDYEGYYDFPGCKDDVVSSARDFRKAIDSGILKRTSIEDCFSEYAQQYVSRRGDLFLIQTDEKLLGGDACSLKEPWGPFNGYAYEAYASANSQFQTWANKSFPFISDPAKVLSYTWQIPYPNVPLADRNPISEQLSRNLTDWRPFGSPVQYCYSEHKEEVCTLNFNVRISLAILACVIVKSLCIYATALWSKRTNLITLGDAIESFMWEEDQHTKGLCTLSGKRIQTLWCSIHIANFWPEQFGQTPNQKYIERKYLQGWAPKKSRWWRSASPLRFHCFVLFICALAIGVASLIHIRSVDGPFDIGIGSQPGKNQINLRTSLPAAVLIANAPQLFCSYVFVSFNYLLTCMYTGSEWVSFSQHRKPLRVTNPSGEQKSTWYLQLPSHVAVPLLALSCLLSWLTSQILFVVQIRVKGSFSVAVAEHNIVTCEYSPGAIFLTVMVGSVIAVAIFLNGLRKYPTTMPLAGTSSAAIAAASHALPKDRYRVTERLRWGVVSQENGLGHCSFSPGIVTPLIPGRKYR